jgi:hypothetical protein
MTDHTRTGARRSRYSWNRRAAIGLGDDVCVYGCFRRRVMGVIAWIGLEGRQQSRSEAAAPFGLIDLRELHQRRPAAASGAR